MKFRVATMLLGMMMTTATKAQTFTEQVGPRLVLPAFATAPEGVEDRLFVAELDGNVRAIDLNDGSVADFLSLDVARGSERGLLGLAFHPDYLDNGKLYVYASRFGGTTDHRSHIFEYTVDGDPAESLTVDPNSQRSVMQFNQPFGNHNGGWIGFDPTATGEERNYLYIATGDGGAGGDPRNNSQDVTENLLGKILRIDVGGQDDFTDDEDQNYAIPPDNPLLGTDADAEIFAFGLRNPWRNSFDRQTGDLWIADVGQGDREEIDLIPSTSAGGQNFGWRVMEGELCFNAGDDRDGNLPCDDASFAEPFFTYGRDSGSVRGRSVTGGYLYRGPVKEFQGHYFFADFGSSNVWTLDPFSGQTVNQNRAVRPDRGNANSGVASFGEDASGNLYVLGLTSGRVLRIDSTSRDAVWWGDDADQGEVGDGTTWDDANNWSRDGMDDVGFVAGDHLLLAGATTPPMSEPRRVSALTFASDATLTVPPATLEVVSKNVFVEEGRTGTLVLEQFGADEGLRKLGPGWLNVDAPDSTGSLAVLEGSMTILSSGEHRVTVAERGSLEQFGEQALQIQQLRLTPTGTLSLNTSANEGVDSVLRTGQLEADGLLVARLPQEFALPAAGQFLNFVLLHTDSRTGDFAETRVGDAHPGHQGDGEFVTIQWDEANRLVLTAYNALAGDTNGDQEVNFADFLWLAANLDGEGSWVDGDFDGNGLVEFDDFLQLSANFGQSAVLQATLANVPEPSAQMLLQLAMGVLLISSNRLARRSVRS